MVKFMPVVAAGMKILEVGCGTGAFKDNFDVACEYWGIEPERDIARIASNNLRQVLEGEYHMVVNDLPDNYFDVVVCNDVIEHMVDPDYFFITIKKKLKSDGLIVGSVPNVRYIKNLINLLVKKDWQYVDYGVLDKAHLRFFTERSLLRMLSKNQFEIESLSGVNGMTSAGKTLVYRSVKFLFMLVAFNLLGYDVRYPQFAFRAKVNG